MKHIYFFSQSTRPLPHHRRILHQWVVALFEKYNKPLLRINYIFCDDAELLEVNKTYLNHDTYTDIITFDNTDDIDLGIEADIYISTQRTADNAKKYAVPPANELHRVMAHGALHLMGYKDKTPADKAIMTDKENEALVMLDDLLKCST